MATILRMLVIFCFAAVIACKSKPPEKPPGALEHIASEDGRSTITLYPDRMEVNINTYGQLGKQHNTDGVMTYELDNLLKVKRNGYITSFLREGDGNWVEINFMPFGSAEGAVTLEQGLKGILEETDSEEIEE